VAFNISWTPYASPNITGFYEGMLYANSVTENWFSPFILIALWIIMFMVLGRTNKDNGFAAASLITFIISGMLRAMGLISDLWILVFLMLTGISVIFLFKD